MKSLLTSAIRTLMSPLSNLNNTLRTMALKLSSLARTGTKNLLKRLAVFLVIRIHPNEYASLLAVPHGTRLAYFVLFDSLPDVQKLMLSEHCPTLEAG